MSAQILLAEDEPHIAKLVMFKLAREGHQVTLAEDGKQAMEKIVEKNWDLIILDVMMPFFDGWEVLKSVRALEAFQKTPILMMTAKAQEKDRSQSAGLGATRFLAKPFDPSELARVVKSLLTGETS